MAPGSHYHCGMAFLRHRVVLIKASNLFTGEVTRTEALMMSTLSQAKKSGIVSCNMKKMILKMSLNIFLLFLKTFMTQQTIF